MQHVLILRCMYVYIIIIPMSVKLGSWGVPSDVIRKRRARVAWLHGSCLRVCRVVTWFARVSHGTHGYMICAHARVTWLHGLRDGQRSPQGAGETSSAKTHVPHVST